MEKKTISQSKLSWIKNPVAHIETSQLMCIINSFLYNTISHQNNLSKTLYIRKIAKLISIFSLDF